MLIKGIPLSTPYPRYQSPSGWNALTAHHQRHCSASLKESYRFIIIGSGFTGLAVARRLAELNPDETILLLDASAIGEGSSGRNSGFMISTPHNQNMSGQHEVNTIARKQIRINQAGENQLSDLIKKYKIDCSWNPVGKYHAAATPLGRLTLEKNAEQLLAWGVDVRMLDREELQSTFGTDYYQYGYHTSHSTFTQPASLVHGLAYHLPENVVLKEKTPVLSIEEGSSYTTLQLAHTHIKAQTVVLANNGFAKSLGLLKNRLVTIYTYAGLTPELAPDELAAHGAEPEWGIIPANRLGTTLRKYNNQRFMVRSAYSYEKELTPPKIQAFLLQLYKNRYPHLKKHEFEFYWGGATALTRNGAYYFGQVKKGIYAAVGCNGGGILKGTAYGKLLAELIMGQDSDLLRDALSLPQPTWIPPEPIRRIAIQSTISYQRQRAGLEQ